jgi:hypothetical protein
LAALVQLARLCDEFLFTHLLDHDSFGIGWVVDLQCSNSSTVNIPHKSTAGVLSANSKLRICDELLLANLLDNNCLGIGRIVHLQGAQERCTKTNTGQLLEADVNNEQLGCAMNSARSV